MSSPYLWQSGTSRKYAAAQSARVAGFEFKERKVRKRKKTQPVKGIAQEEPWDHDYQPGKKLPPPPKKTVVRSRGERKRVNRENDPPPISIDYEAKLIPFPRVDMKNFRKTGCIFGAEWAEQRAARREYWAKEKRQRLRELERIRVKVPGFL